MASQVVFARSVAVSLVVGLGMALASTTMAAPDAPLGHKDFYPSDERPVGFCGDGNAYFPGATPVTEFWDGTPTQIKHPWKDRRSKEATPIDMWDFKDQTSKNIAWKTEMPSWANTQPIVVGDRVFTYAEPYTLVCVDANSGKILWTVDANPWLCAGVEAKAAEKCDQLFEVFQALPFYPGMVKNTTVYSLVSPDAWDKMLPILEQKVLPRVVTSLEKIDPGPKWKEAARASLVELKLHQKRLRDAWGDQTKMRKVKTNSRQLEALHNLIEQRIGAISGMKRQEGVDLVLSWGWMIGSAMNAPVSDGKYVYASFAYGSTICVDLNGKVIWRRWFPNEGNNRTQCQSGLLSGDIYVDMHGGAKVLRGLNKKTGETVWEAPTLTPDIKSNRGGYYVGSHKIVTVTDGEKKLDVVVTTLCNIIRASDGKQVGSLPWKESRGPSGGPSIMNVGNIVFKGANGDGFSVPLHAYKLTLVSRDQVKAEQLWVGDRRLSPGYNQQVATPDYLVLTVKDAGNVTDPQTGKPMFKPRRDGRVGGLSNIVAGDKLFWAEEGQRFSVWTGILSNWYGRRHDEKAFALFRCADMSDPSKPKVISRKNLLGGSDYPRLPAMEKYAPELYELPLYTGAAWGRPAHRLHTDTALFASGNRLFIRTIGHLYSIGNPAVPYDWNPASRPKEITSMLKIE